MKNLKQQHSCWSVSRKEVHHANYHLGAVVDSARFLEALSIAKTLIGALKAQPSRRERTFANDHSN
jgi:hypothetical protein